MDVLEDILDKYVKEELFNKTDSTKDTYLRSIKDFLKWVDDSGLVLEDAKTDEYGISKLDLQTYIQYLHRKLEKAPQTVKKDWAGVRSLLVWKGMGDLTTNISLPDSVSSKEEAPKIIDDNKINEIVREEYRKAERTGNWRDCCIVIIFAYFGLRVDEVRQLNLSSLEITLRKGHLRVWGKGNKERVIPLPSTDKKPIVREVLTKYLTDRVRLETEEKALFLSNRGNRISKRAMQNVVDKHGVNCHAFRHSFITKLVRNGTDISLIMSLTGHTSAEMIVRYSKPSDEDKANALGDIDYGL